MTGPGFEPLIYATCAALVGLGAPHAARRAAREVRWWLDDRRAARAWQETSQPAYAAELAAARAELAARGADRAAVSEARLPDARALRPVGTPLDILRDRR